MTLLKLHVFFLKEEVRELSVDQQEYIWGFGDLRRSERKLTWPGPPPRFCGTWKLATWNSVLLGAHFRLRCVATSHACKVANRSLGATSIKCWPTQSLCDHRHTHTTQERIIAQPKLELAETSERQIHTHITSVKNHPASRVIGREDGTPRARDAAVDPDRGPPLPLPGRRLLMAVVHGGTTATAG